MKKDLQNSSKSHVAVPAFYMEGHPLLEWITKQGSLLLFTFLGTFALLFILYLWLAGGEAQTEKNYLIANEQFILLQQAKDPEAVNKALSALQQLMQTSPDLKAKYEARVAQILINKNEINEALPLANAVLNRVKKDNLPFYINFSQITLLIAEGQYSEALNLSLKLKEDMLANLTEISSTAEKTFGSYLFATNLLRIAFLGEKVDRPKEELQSWEEWKAFTSADNGQIIASSLDKRPFFNLMQVYNDGLVNLDQYVNERINKLMTLQEK